MENRMKYLMGFLIGSMRVSKSQSATSMLNTLFRLSGSHNPF